MRSQIISLSLLAAPLISAHGLISSAKGNVGGTSIGLGVKTAEDNTLNDVTVFSSATGFGKTGASGNVVPATLFAAQSSTAVAQVSTSAGVLTMVYHQINADGAGPMTCSVSADATGKTFTAMTVTTNVPGTNGKSSAANQDFPLVASMPAGTTCSGTVGSVTNACVVKCQNPAGPFGSNLVVTQGGAAAAAGSASTAKTAAKAKTAKAAPRDLDNLLESIEQDLTGAFSTGSGNSKSENSNKGTGGSGLGVASTGASKNGTAAAAKKAGKKGTGAGAAAVNGTATASGKGSSAVNGTATATADAKTKGGKKEAGKAIVRARRGEGSWFF